MGILIDIIVFCVVLLFAFIGYKQGLLKSLIKFLSFFLAIIIALVLYKPISRIIINNTPIDENIKNVIVDKVQLKEKENYDGNLQVEIQNRIFNTAETAIDKTSNEISIKIVEILTLIVLFLLLRIVLIIITLLTDLIAKLPVIKQANKLGGIVFGFIKGMFLIYIILTVIYLISSITKNELNTQIDKTYITKYLYNNNVILMVINNRQ